MKAQRIFISYRRAAGAASARIVREALVQRGFRVFMDVQDLGSGKFEAAIQHQLEQCTDFVVLLTPGCLDQCKAERDWFRWEICQAIALGKNIVPVVTDGFVLWPELGSDIKVLQSYQALMYTPHLHDASMDKLASWLRPPVLKPVLPFARVLSIVLLLSLVGIFFGWAWFHRPWGSRVSEEGRVPNNSTNSAQVVLAHELSGANFGAGGVVCAVAFSPDGRWIGWGNEWTGSDIDKTWLADSGLQHVFDLSEIRPGQQAVVGDDWKRALLTLTDWSAERPETARHILIVRHNGREASKVVRSSSEDTILCYSFVTNRNLIVGSTSKLTLSRNHAVRLRISG